MKMRVKSWLSQEDGEEAFCHVGVWLGEAAININLEDIDSADKIIDFGPFKTFDEASFFLKGWLRGKIQDFLLDTSEPGVAFLEASFGLDMRFEK